MARSKRHTYIVTILVDYYHLAFPPLSQREFVKAVGYWFLWTRRFKANEKIGPFRVDFTSYHKWQLILIDDKKKQPDDIVRHSEDMRRRGMQDEYFFKKGYDVFRISAIDIYTDRESVSSTIKEWSKSPRKYYERYLPEEN